LAVQRGTQHLDDAADLSLEAHIVDKQTQDPLAAIAAAAAQSDTRDLEPRVLALESRLAQSLAVTDELRGSRAWKLIEALRRIRVRWAPPGSLRERLWFAVLDTLRR
jgi:hypothetical protein